MSKVKRRYTPEERATYHSNRMRTLSYPSNKKFYSQSWLEGFMETSHVKTKLDEVQATIDFRKSNGSLTKERKTDLYGYRAGLRARLEKEKQANRLRQPDKVQRQKPVYDYSDDLDFDDCGHIKGHYVNGRFEPN